jgi:hypothetical protein
LLAELFKIWCDSYEEQDGRKLYWSFSEKKSGRDAIQKSLAKTVRSHYCTARNLSLERGELALAAKSD